MNISSAGGNHGSGSQDFELNLASIIDCLTVLITFLLASTAFISIGILDAGVAAAGSTATQTAPPPVNFTLEIGKGDSMTIKVTGKSSLTEKVSGFDGLTQKLATLHQRWPSVNAITLTADSAVEYEDVVKVMNTTRKTIPVVLLGGF